MAAKRDLASVTDSELDFSPSEPSTKRARKATGQHKKPTNKQQQEPATDVTYGQRCCFPGLDSSVANSDEDLDFEDETDALAYLQSVRQEASGIPHLLVAPKSGPRLPARRDDDHLDHDSGEVSVDRSIYETGHGDTRGYYKDGAYTAAPDDSHANTDHGASRLDAAYFASLATHFLALRTHLYRSPPHGALAALTAQQSPHVGRFGPSSRTFSVWSSRLRQADPHPVQIAAMDKGAVLRILRVLLGGKFLRRGVELRERTSRWLWALLARLPDRGELDHTEVGHVRDLGKRAALLMWSLKEMAMLREEVEVGQEDGGEEEEEEEANADELGPHADGVGEEVWVGGADDDDDGGYHDNEDEAEKREVSPVADRHKEPFPPPASDSDPVPSSSTAPTSVPDGHANRDANIKADKNEEVEDGEIADDSVPMDLEEDIESAKARLLANLEVMGDSSTAESGSKDAGQQEETAFDPVRARMNMRATLNMILTVAGEFYGQRDLLEFRDPFHGI